MLEMAELLETLINKGEIPPQFDFLLSTEKTKQGYVYQVDNEDVLCFEKISDYRKSSRQQLSISEVRKNCIVIPLSEIKNIQLINKDNFSEEQVNDVLTRLYNLLKR